MPPCVTRRLPQSEAGHHGIPPRCDCDRFVPGNTSIQVAMDYVASEAPEEVLRTMSWLRDNGWRPTTGWVRPEAFGNALAEFRKADSEVQILRDRGQWIVSIRLADWNDWVDLGLIVDAKSGRTDWGEPSGNPYENKQLPVGIKWVDTVPYALQVDCYDRKRRVEAGQTPSRTVSAAAPRLTVPIALPQFAGYTCDPPPGIGIRGNLLGCIPEQEVCGGVDPVFRVSRPSRR